MNREDVIRMAREAGLCTWTITPDERVAEWARFAALVAAAEREECAKVCEEHPDGMSMLGGDFVTCAAAIRARGKAPVQTCCAGGPQWGHAWECKELP